MKSTFKSAVPLFLVLSVAACGGGGLSVELPGGERTLELDFPPREAKEYRLPFIISGGIPPYESSIEGCPDWVTLFPDQGVLAGTAPIGEIGNTFFCTYRVTESDSRFRPRSSVTYGLRLVVGALPGGSLDLPATPARVRFVIGDFRSFTLPAATGGVPPYTYTFECVGGPPSGVGFAPATRVLAGTADTVFHDSCAYTVTDSSQPASTVSRAIVVSVESLDLSGDIPDQVRFVIGDFRSFTLPAATGGVEPYMYEFTCTGGGLPPGLGFAPATRELGGVTGAVFRDECEYTVTDSSQPASTVSRDIVVTSAAAESLDLPVIPDQRFVIDTFRSVTLPAARGGVGPYTYEFTCAGRLLSGVGFAPVTRVLAGVANAEFPKTTCTYMVTDSSQPPATVSRDLDVTVESLDLPDTPEKVRFVVGTSRSVTLPAARGGVAPYTYTFDCGGSLPSEIDFTPETRRLAVVADAGDAGFRDSSCTYTVTDSSDSAVTVSRTIEVTVESLHLPDTPEKIRFVIGDFRSITLPAATGGVGPYTYTFTCGGSLPSGVGFAPATRRLAGVANAAFPTTTCAYTVTDSSTSPVMVERAIEVTVESLDLPNTPENVRFVIGDFRSITLPAATGGEPPYTYTFTCAGGRLPPGVRFSPATPVPASTRPVLAGTGDAVFRDSCRYTVTDSSRPAATVSKNIEVVVDPFARGRWRFRTRSLDPSDHPINRKDSDEQVLVVLPHALPETGFADDCVTYRLSGTLVPDPFGFGPDSRRLTYTYPGVDPLFDAPTTLRYEVRTYPESGGEECGMPGDVKYETQDALCVDVSYRDSLPGGDTRDGLLSAVRVSIRDHASFDGTEYRCPDAASQSASSSDASVSNPVHSALAPVHARRAAGVAHAAVRDRVRDWSPELPGAPHGFAITPSVDFASLSGLSDGFDYSGSSESVSGGVEAGAGAWQVGLVGSFTRTDLRYHAEAGLSARGYHAGEHDTEILSVHPFAAWHAPSGGHLWASLGAGTGDLRHRDDLGFRSWSRSDVRLRAWAAGLSVPVARVLSGDLDAEAGIESFAFEIEGGGRISTALPTLRGRDWRAGLAWSALVSGAPSLSLAWRRSTGDGPEGTRMEAQGSMSAEGVLDPRLTVTGSAAASFGLGDYEHDSWRIGGGAHFAPGGSGRGFGLDVDLRLKSPDDERPAGVGVRSEAGYGLWSGSLLGTVRPYVGLVRHPGDAFVRRTVGLDLRDTPATRVRVEVVDHHRAPSPALELTVRHHF